MFIRIDSWPIKLALLTATAVLLPAAELHVAAASDLTRVLPQLIAAFEPQSRIHVVPSFGPTAQFTQQLESGAPFDVFLAADTAHIDQLVRNGFVYADSRQIYARGGLAVWAPASPDIRALGDLTKANVVNIALANPDLAPYGAAAREALRTANLWTRLEKKVVYAPSVASAKQFADTGNVAASFVSLGLVFGLSGNYFIVDEKLHSPLEQALCINKNTKDLPSAKAFVRFLATPAARAVFQRFGYGQP